MLFYNLMTLNAAAMLDNEIVRLWDGDHNYKPEYRYDFNDGSTKNLVLEETNPHADNALYYQLIASVYGDSYLDYLDQKDCIVRSLIYLDFCELFSPQDRKNSRLSVSKWTGDAIDAKCSVLFEDGFTLVYEDGEVRHYVPFDKTASMSRHYSMSFVDEAVFPEIDRRLKMGMDFSNIQVVLSKYYAYRGLYLTDGVRIEENSDFVLDQNTVLVIDDDSHDYMIGGEKQNVPVITADVDLLKQGIFQSIEKMHTIRLNGFDGEGFLSPHYAEIIDLANREVIYAKKPAASFQIRMPFIKGMLHKVDFHGFFKEQMGEQDYYIKDLFGIPRKIEHVQIILTKSMFKCADWLTAHWENHRKEIDDPVKWFFEQFHKLNHALYISNTDSNMGNMNVSLTYQFINTMGIDPITLDKLVKAHFNKAHSIPKTGATYAVDLTEYAVESVFGESVSNIPAWRFALDLNPDFVGDPHVKTILKRDENNRIKDVCGGNIVVEGALKYLSGDLLALLCHIIYNKKAESKDGIGGANGLGVLTEQGFTLDEDYNKGVVEKLKTQLIRTGKFYTADSKRMSLSRDKRYSILRNPHLARNEQCSLKAFLPDGKENIYVRFFSHLKNVLMLPYESVDALSLGGADYDGDLVKIMLKSSVNDTVLKGAYEYAKESKDYVRKYPIVEIPSLKANREKVPDSIPYRLVKDTFSNQVGMISNRAIRKGKWIYLQDDIDKESRNLCAECTLAAGLELDAVKTGVRPDVKSWISTESDYYLSREKAIDKEKQIERLIYTKKKKKGKYGGDYYLAEKSLYSGKGKRLQTVIDAEFIPLKKDSPIVDRLPGYFLKEMYDARNKVADDDKKKETSKELLLFKFQVDEMTGQLDSDWSKRLKKETGADEKMYKLKALMKAYRRIVSDSRFYQRQKETAKNSKNINKIWTLMNKIFDINKEGLPDTKTSIPDAIEIARIDMRNIFGSLDEVCRAIDKMKENDWILKDSTERESCLEKILGKEKYDQLQAETREILLTNEENGFYFLQFYLYEIKNEIIGEASVEDILNIGRDDAKSLEGYSPEAYAGFLHEYVKGQDNKEKKEIWNERILDLCRKAIIEMFDGNMDEALKYYYSCRTTDPSRYFLWDVFHTNEILRNVYIKEDEKHA